MGKATHVLSIYCIIKNKTNLIVLYSYIYLYIYTVQRFPYHHKFIVTRLTCTVNLLFHIRHKGNTLLNAVG